MNEKQKKIMVPYEQPTDTCPDCSNIPCDCGIPAGYKADIRFACNFAPHIKVIEAGKVEEIIEQRDRLADQLDSTLLRLGRTQEKMFNAERQRDRLAGGLKWIAGWNHQLFDESTAMQMRDKAEQALQSLNPDHTVDANDMTAVVKGGADES